MEKGWFSKMEKGWFAKISVDWWFLALKIRPVETKEHFLWKQRQNSKRLGTFRLCECGLRVGNNSSPTTSRRFFLDSIETGSCRMDSSCLYGISTLLFSVWFASCKVRQINNYKSSFFSPVKLEYNYFALRTQDFLRLHTEFHLSIGLCKRLNCYYFQSIFLLNTSKSVSQKYH